MDSNLLAKHFVDACYAALKINKLYLNTGCKSLKIPFDFNVDRLAIKGRMEAGETNRDE